MQLCPIDRRFPFRGNQPRGLPFPVAGILPLGHPVEGAGDEDRTLAALPAFLALIVLGAAAIVLNWSLCSFGGGVDRGRPCCPISYQNLKNGTSTLFSVVPEVGLEPTRPVKCAGF